MIANNTAGVQSAIVARRGLAEVREVRAALSMVDNEILQASAERPLREEEGYADNLRIMFKYIAIDCGYKATDEMTHAYNLTRIIEAIQKYYGELSIKEIKLAFELCAVGELDLYLPKDSNGNPDKKHYQAFNVDFVTKILNAYRNRQNAAISKAYAALPKENAAMTTEEKAELEQHQKERIVEIYNNYKNDGKFADSPVGLEAVYDALLKVGYVQPVEVTEEDRNTAFILYKQKARKGLVNQYQAAFVIRQGAQHEEITYPARIVARNKAIRQAFDKMISNNIQIEDLWQTKKKN